jgi:predicted TIM-barrel fold metal-dependent hydrolase
VPEGIIDITVNPWTPLEVEQGQVGVDEHFYNKIRVPPEARVGLSWEKYLEKKDRAGIQRSLLVATRAGDSRARFSFHIPYERVAETCEKWPDRFSGLAGIDPTRGMEGLREFERGITELGFVGGHIYPHWFDLPPDHRSFYPFYAKACELDVPIMMQIGHCLDYMRDKIFHSVGRPITLENIAIDLPEVKLIGIHLGWPWTEEMIAVAYKHNNVYMCGDAYAPKHWPAEYVRFIDSWGQDKCLFGTDWPVIDPERAVEECEALGLRSGSKEKFYRTNALKLFRLPESAELDGVAAATAGAASA